jgi:hypothetical protein
MQIVVIEIDIKMLLLPKTLSHLFTAKVYAACVTGQGLETLILLHYLGQPEVDEDWLTISGT